MSDDKKRINDYSSDNFDTEATKIQEKENVANSQESEFKSALNNENKTVPPEAAGEAGRVSNSNLEGAGKKVSNAASNAVKKKTTNAVKNKANIAAAKVGKKAKKQATKVAAGLAKKIAASVLANGMPWLIAGGAAIGGVVLLSYFAGLVVDTEFSRAQDVNYAHSSMADLNTVMTNQMGSKGNVFFNSETGRYELAKGKQPTQANKLQYVYYAVMSNQSKWFVTYQRDKNVKYKPQAELKEELAKKIEGIDKDSNLSDTDKAKKIQEAVDDSQLKYYKPVEIKGDKRQYTLDGKMFNLNEIDKVGLKGNDPGEAVTLDNVLNEKSSKYIEKLALNVNLLYLLDSTLNGSELGTGKNQMFFGEQFVKPVYHDENYNFKPLTEYRTKTENEKEKTLAKAHGDDSDSQVEKEFQEKYNDWTEKLNAQNLARGGGKSVTEPESQGTSSDGINNPILAKAFDWGSSQLNKGITYSMGARTGPTSYDCSGFVLTALNQAGFEVPVFNTVAMLQATEWMDGPDGGIPGEGKLEFGNKKYFKQVDLKTAKKGTIVVVGGINGGGAAGHTFFLAEDFHGGETKVLECSGGANGINNQGTYQWASMGELHPVAIEPKGTSTDSDDKDKDKDNNENSGSTNGHNDSGDYSKYIETSLRNQVSTGKLVAQSRKFNTSYSPEIKSGLYKKENINYNVWREGDFFVNNDSLRDYINWIDFSQASGNSTFNTSGPVKEQSGAAEKSKDGNILHDYSSDRAELTKWSLDNGYNPAFVASLIDVMSNNSNKNFFGTDYNFLNDTNIMGSKTGTVSQAKATDASKTNKELEEVIQKAMSKMPNTSLGKPYWSVSLKGISDTKLKADISSQGAPDKQFSASTIKLFIATSVYKQVENKKLKEKDVKDDLMLMINQSNNDATNRLIDKVGGLNQINKDIQETLGGNAKTSLNRKLGGNITIDTPENYTNASELTDFLVKLDDGKILNKDNTAELKSFMTNTGVQYKFMSKLPDGAKAINKSGENAVRGTENDSAIIEYKGFKFALSALVTAQPDGQEPKSLSESELNKMNEVLAELAKEVTKTIGESGDVKDYGNYGADEYDNTFKINTMSQGLTALFDKFEEDNPNKSWNQDIAKKLKLSRVQYDRINSEYDKAGGMVSEVTIPKELSSKITKDDFYTYKGSGFDDTKGLGNIQIDGKTNDTQVGNSKLYYVKEENVSQADAAVTPSDGSSALLKDSNGNPEMTTGVWDYGFGSIFKIARNEYSAYQIGMDEHGKYQIVGDSGFLTNLGQQLADGTYNSAKDTEYTIIGVTTPFGTINLADEFVKDSSEFDDVIQKLNNHEDLSNADVQLLEKHKEGSTIKVNGETKTAEDGNSFYSDKPVVSATPELQDAQGGQYIMDYLENYTTYVPNITESKLDPLKRWKAMNDINASSQDGMNKIQDIFNKLIGDEDKNSDSNSNTGDTGDGSGVDGFDKETMKKIYDGLIERGMGTYGAVGVMTNMAHESGFRPDAINASSGAMGLSQWLGGRADGLKQFAAAKGKPWQDIDVQLDYLVSGEPGVIHDVVVKVAQNKDQYQATRDFYIAWEMHGGGISYIGMSEEQILADPITSGNGSDRIKKENVDKMYNEVVGKDGKVIEPDMTKLGGTASSGSNSSSDKNSDGTSTANWGDGTSFFSKVTGFLHDIKSTVLEIFGNDKNWDPTMFSTDPIKPISSASAKPSELIYDKDGNIMNDKLIVNGVDAYKWKKYSNPLSTDNAKMLLRQFVASFESRDERPVYYDEVYDTFNDYDLDRIVEENYKYNLMKLFEKDDDSVKNQENEVQVSSPIKGQDITASKAKGTAGYIKDGNTVDVHPGLTFTGDNKDVVALKAGKVVYSGSDGKYGNTVIIRSTDNTEQIAYTNLGRVSSPKVGKTVTAGDTIGRTSSSGVTVVGINKNADAGYGLTKLKMPKAPSDFANNSSDIYDLVNYFGISGPNQAKLIKDTNGYDSEKFKDKKPSVSEIGASKEVELKNYVSVTNTSSGSSNLDIPAGWSVSKPDPNPSKYDASSYPFGQCTWFTYNRALELGIKYDKYMGNGGQWQTKPGYQVTTTPTKHSAVSFKGGEAGSDPAYGHVAFVEDVKSDGSILVSESNVRGLGVISYRTFSAQDAKQFHYVIGK